MGLCWADRSYQPVLRWCAGMVLTLLLASPLLFPAAQSYFHSPRAAPLPLEVVAQSSVPAPALLLAYFGGYLGVLLGDSLGLFGRQLVLGLASCIANWQFFACWHKRRAFSRLEIVLVAVASLVALFMSRPHWLGEIVSQIPLLRSLRWPFRETLIFLFLAHVWIALRSVTVAPRTLWLTSGLGAAVFLLSLAIVPPWNFSPMSIDRQLLISGEAHAYWERVKPLIGDGNRIMAVVSQKITTDHEREIPFSLLGAANYPALFGVPSISGYTAQGFARPQLAEEVPYFFGGIYSPQTSQKMLSKNRNLRALHLVSIQPLRIDLCSAQGCQTLPLPPLARAVQ
jgi:hypothetical protein